MIMRPRFSCLQPACVAASVPRTLMSIMRSISSSVVSSNVFRERLCPHCSQAHQVRRSRTVFSTAASTGAGISGAA